MTMTIPMGVSEKANYITCPQGHKVYVIWSPRFKKFGFTCDECGEHAVRAWSSDTGHLVEIRIVRRLKEGERMV